MLHNFRSGHRLIRDKDGRKPDKVIKYPAGLVKSNVDSVIQRFLLFVLIVEGEHQEPFAGVNSAASRCLQCESTCLESYTFSNHRSATAYTSFFTRNIHTPDFHMIVLKTDSISSVHATFSSDLSSSRP